MAKSIAQINERIRAGKAVVVTAEEITDIVADVGAKKAAEKVDVVTTGTFGPMCSSGAYLNVGHTRPRIKLGGGQVLLNNVPVFTGFAAVDILIGATSVAADDPLNKVFPGEFRYGGGHLIHDLVAGKEVEIVATAYGTDCYPRRDLRSRFSLREVNEAVLFNPRNAYQNYNVAVNLHGDRTLYTYMGLLRPGPGNANYCSAGQLSPLLCDPHYRTIGIGTRVFLGGGVGYVAWWGTQHNPSVKRGANGVPIGGGGTLALIGDLKQMKPEYLVGASLRGYGVSLAVGVGIPIPVLDEGVAAAAAVTDAAISAPIVDYSRGYPQRTGKVVGSVTYAELRSGTIEVAGRKIPTVPLSSYRKARKIAETLKEWIGEGRFLLAEPVQPLPGADSGYTVKPFPEKS